jgi:hypothetical protein
MAWETPMTKYYITRLRADGVFSSRVIEAIDIAAAERTASVFFGRYRDGDITSVAVLQ